MKHFLILFKEPTANDVMSSFQFFEEQKRGLGEKFIKHIDATLASISKNPTLFPVRFKEMREARVRRFPFVILYEIEEKHVIVYAVFHTRQSPKKKTTRVR